MSSIGRNRVVRPFSTPVSRPSLRQNSADYRADSARETGQTSLSFPLPHCLVLNLLLVSIMAHDRMAPVSTATTRSSPPTRNFFPSSNSSHSISASTASVIRSSSSSSLATQSSQTIVSNSTRQRDRERKDLGDERAATSSSTVSTTSSIDKPFTVKPTARRTRRSTQSSQDGVSSTTQRKPEQMETTVGLASYSSVKEVPLTILESPLASSETNYLSSSSGGPGSDKEEASSSASSSAALNLAHQQHLRMKPSRMVVKRRATVPAPTTSTVTSTVPPPPPNTTPTTTTRRNGRPGPSPPKHLERWQLRLRRSISGNSSSTDEEHGFSTHEQPSRRFETSSRRRQLQSPPSSQSPSSPSQSSSPPPSSSSSSSLTVTSPRTAARQVVAPKSPFETTQKLARPVRIRYETPERGRGGKVEISHASLGKLIARLTDAHQYDTEFRDVFLLTFPCFCSPYDFIKKLLKRYTAVLSLCATVDEQTLDEMQRRLDEIMAQEEEEDEERTEDDEKTGHHQHRASIITSISTARSDINTNMEANVSIMRLLSVLKFWIKESGFIEHDVAWDRKTAKKLLSFLTEIHQTAPIPSIRTHAETLLVYVTQVVKKQRQHALGGHAKAPIVASAPVLHQLSDRGASHSRLRSQAATKLALARSSSDPKQKHDKKVGHNSPPRLDLVATPGVLLATRAPKIARGITTGSADAFGLDEVMQETLQRARVTAASRKSARSGYESVDPLAGFSAPDLADQLTLIEVEQYFIPLDPRELTNKAWTREATKHVDAPHVMALIELFDATAEWVSSEILHPQLQAVERAKMITLFIDAAHRCYQLNNFNTLFELVTGLSAPCIRQLNTTWSLVSATAQEKYTCLTQLCAPDDNYRNYRQAFALAEGQPRLACWFLLVKDLFTYEEAMKSVEEGLVNWQKFRKIYRVISEALDRQNFNYVAAGNGPNGGLNSGRKGRGGMLRHDRKTQQLLRHRVDTIRKDSTVLYQLARNANTQESILFVNSLSEAGFL